MLDRILWYSYPVVYGGNCVDFPEIRKAVNSRKSKLKRSRKYIFEMAQSYESLDFLTLTFTDDVLLRTSERTRHRYVASHLNEYYRDYYANVDYGEKNHREHYHAVVAPYPEKPCPVWQYGYSKSKKIYLGYRSNSIKKVTAYMHKIVLHANKYTSGNSFHKRGLKLVDSLPF